MELTQRRTKFRELLSQKICISPASVHDPISVRIAENLGYEIGMFAGSIASMTILGDPDLILITQTEFAQQIQRICRAANLPLMVDADHGYGNALNVRRTVEELETAGVSCLTIEDTLLPINYGTDNGAALITLEEGVGKMKAAVDARQDTTLTIAGRTSALAISGIEETVKRAKAYEEAGVDALFLAGATRREEITTVSEAINIPLMLGSITDDLNDRQFLAQNGVRVALQGHLPFSAAIQGIYDTLKALREGIPPSELANNVASPELMAKVTRRKDFGEMINKYLN